MRRPTLILCGSLALLLGAGNPAWTSGLTSAQGPPATPLRALGTPISTMDPGINGADAAFAAWLRAQRLPAAAQMAAPPTIDEIKVELRRQAQVRELLGANRYRRLTRARFKVHVYDLHLQPYREFEQVSALYDDIESSMRSNFGKIARDWVERRLGLDERIESWERRRDARKKAATAGSLSPSLSVSPRFAAGSHPYVGTKLRLRHAPNAFLSRLSLKAKYGLDGGESGLRLTWQTRDHYVSLEQLFDDPYEGDVLSLSLRFTF